MSTAAGAALTGEFARAFAEGFSKIEIQSLSIVSGDTGATITAKNLASVQLAVPMLSSVTLTGLPSISGNVVTLAFTDPAANRFGYVVLYGK